MIMIEPNTTGFFYTSIRVFPHNLGERFLVQGLHLTTFQHTTSVLSMVDIIAEQFKDNRSYTNNRGLLTQLVHTIGT